MQLNGLSQNRFWQRGAAGVADRVCASARGRAGLCGAGAG
jgi:hypothetical protein